MAVGILVDVAIGAATKQLPIGLAIGVGGGMSIGIAIGAAKDKKEQPQ